MSAIWGIIDFEGNTLKKNEIQILFDSYSEYKIDKVQDFSIDRVYMASGIQYVNREAQYEQYPYISVNNKIMVADAIIDNRKEMISEFKLKNDLSLKGVDGSILFEMISDNLSQALDKLCGAFVFAEYDQAEDTLYVANDVTGTRSLYYTFCKGRFVFSSLIRSLLPFLDKIEVEEEWLSQFIENDNLVIVDSPSLTPYKALYRLEPGELLIVKRHGIEHIQYWDPVKKIKPLKLKTDDEYKSLVLDTFKKCVESVIREPGEIGIFLSGGLDSNAVAAFAAPYLKKQGKNLFSYTSVPNDRIEPVPKNSYYVSNERIYIEKIKEYHTNLIPSFIDVSKLDIMSEFEKVSKLVETPVKTVVNVPWLHKAYDQAQKDGCRILLGGQYGNITISFGFINDLFASLKFSGRIISLIKAVNQYGKKYNISRKRVLINALKEEKDNTLKKSREYMYDKKALRQVGESELHESLATGVIYRDPTRDRRLIELVLSLPIKVFVNPDTDRRLVREYMKDIIPYNVVADRFHRGSQGDAGYDTIRANWTDIKEKLIKKYNLPAGKKYLSKLNLCEWIETVDKDDKTNEFNLIKAIYYGSLCEYLENMK